MRLETRERPKIVFFVNQNEDSPAGKTSPFQRQNGKLVGNQ
jgi:hypothetical protein